MRWWVGRNLGGEGGGYVGGRGRNQRPTTGASLDAVSVVASSKEGLGGTAHTAGEGKEPGEIGATACPRKRRCALPSYAVLIGFIALANSTPHVHLVFSFSFA
eukprot:GHVU01108324.1.p3 GENE.GHVU01108324.1~~GHVU01108324.1.p3  ORF type:complete len:103 (+),score=6.94 GHVU01108324.1:229-537(+)